MNIDESDDTPSMMDAATFQKYMDANDLGSILANGGYDLTPQQLQLVKERAKENSKHELELRKARLATKKGYVDSVLLPLQKQILENAINTANNSKNELDTDHEINQAVEKSSREIKKELKEAKKKVEKAKTGTSYQRGKKLRSTGLSDLIIDRMAKGQSVTGSTGAAISDKFRGLALGIGEKFDPLNLVKFMTFGSKLATGAFGKLTGRSQEDIDYFTGRKKKKGDATRISDETKTLAGMSGSIEPLSKIYNFLQNSRDEKRKDLETLKSFEENKMNEEERQHNEVINVFNKALGKKQRQEKNLSSMKMNFDKLFEKKKAAAKMKEDESDEGFMGGLAKSFVKVAAVGGIMVLGTGAAAHSVYKDQMKKKEPSGTTATKVPEERVTSIENDTVKGRIRAREGGATDGYNAINRVAGTDNSWMVQPGNVDITTKQPYEKGLTSMTILDVIDLQKRRSKHYGKSGMGAAAGAYGFMPNTLIALAKERFGADKWAQVPFTKEVQDLLADDLLKIIKRNIEKAKLPLSEAMIYTMWFVGQNAPNTAYQMVYGNESTLLDDILDKNALVANPSFKGKTVGWYKETILKNKSKGEMSNIPLQGTVPGDTLDGMQKENTNAKDNLTGEKQSSLFINRIVNPSVVNQYISQVAMVVEPHPILG